MFNRVSLVMGLMAAVLIAWALLTNGAEYVKGMPHDPCYDLVKKEIERHDHEVKARFFDWLAERTEVSHMARRHRDSADAERTIVKHIDLDLSVLRDKAQGAGCVEDPLRLR